MKGISLSSVIQVINLERVSPTREVLLERIRVVVLHETAHYFGYTEGQLRSMGLA